MYGGARSPEEYTTDTVSVLRRTPLEGSISDKSSGTMSNNSERTRCMPSYETRVRFFGDLRFGFKKGHWAKNNEER